MGNRTGTEQQLEIEMERFDAMPADWRHFAHEYGMQRAEIFRQHGHSAQSAMDAMQAGYQDFLEEIEFFLS